MNGEKALSQYFFDAAEKAWSDSGRDKAPIKMGGFWYSLADDGESKLKEYVFDYLKIMGEEEARNTANTMTRFTPEAVIEALDATEEAGAEEIFLVPATADISEVDRIAELIAKR